MTVVEHARAVEAADLPKGFLHVVVFGPGHGEAVLVRMPDGRVGVVDGCGKMPEGSNRGSPIFGLLKELAEERLLFACLTHPHRDHFRGFAEIIKRHPPEHLWWSGTQERRFFAHYVGYLEMVGRGVSVDAFDPSLADDLQGVVEAIGHLADRPAITPRPRGQHLSDWKRVLAHALIDGSSVFVESVLPSSAATRIAEQEALDALKTGAPIERGLDPNRISAALVLKWGTTRVLLGGDALNGDPDDFAGWEGLQFPLEKMHLVKVPHHASEKAHSTRRWVEMTPDLAIVTCVQHASAKQPPRPAMLQKILETGSRVALTSRPTWWAEPHALECGPTTWGPVGVVRGPGNPALVGKARPASAASHHENAVVVRLDDKGNIVQVQLHGASRELRVAPAPAATP